MDVIWIGCLFVGGLIYELYFGMFIFEGMFDVVVICFDYLVDLGVIYVEFFLVNVFNGFWNWGYDGVFWYVVYELYGGLEVYQCFVDVVYVWGLVVVQDVVYNYFGLSGNYLLLFGFYLCEGESIIWGDFVNFDEFVVWEYIFDNVLLWLCDFYVDGLCLDVVYVLYDW